MNAQSWEIERLVNRSGNRLSGTEAAIARAEVKRLSYDDSTVFVHLSKEAVAKLPAHLPNARSST